ncbi:MAG: glycosyltransferase [Planctomycetales bacterium]|nr:glycosyltransferase [Planctomycetales bacterium]MBN8628671.1 glycosyltransferase [Planctomycetota bacterium]
MDAHLTAIVIPCLNEEHHLISTCGSLGFGADRSPPDRALLVLVDNGSEDRTIEVAESIQQSCPGGCVIITTESERGYVPPRRSGNRLAIATACDRGIGRDNLLIIQADADTLYEDGYLNEIRLAAERHGPGVMIDAVIEYDKDFIVRRADYVSLCNEVDEQFGLILPDQSQDVIVDDKACAYWASDYELWGGHQREYTSFGDEIHAESARLYIRGLTYGASRYLCESAIARHSNRRTVADPAFAFATAGFPREMRFRCRWEDVYDGVNDIAEFAKVVNRPSIQLAIRCRRAHTEGLFIMLTAHVSRALNPKGADTWTGSLGSLPMRNVEIARGTPGVLIEDVLTEVDKFAFQLEN